MQLLLNLRGGFHYSDGSSVLLEHALALLLPSNIVEVAQLAQQ